MYLLLGTNIVKETGKVIGIDMTENMLNKARENAEKHGYTNVEFKRGILDKEYRLRIILLM